MVTMGTGNTEFRPEFIICLTLIHKEYMPQIMILCPMYIYIYITFCIQRTIYAYMVVMPIGSPNHYPFWQATGTTQCRAQRDYPDYCKLVGNMLDPAL